VYSPVTATVLAYWPTVSVIFEALHIPVYSIFVYSRDAVSMESLLRRYHLYAMWLLYQKHFHLNNYGAYFDFQRISQNACYILNIFIDFLRPKIAIGYILTILEQFYVYIFLDYFCFILAVLELKLRNLLQIY